MVAGAPGARRAGREASQVFNIVLYAPEIPANTGNIGRTCVLTGSRLHLVEPLGFSLDSRMLRRAGLGYWQNLDVVRYAGWDEFLRQNGLAGAAGAPGAPDGATPEGAPRLHLLTKKARRTYAESTYRGGDYLVFGSESTGIPEQVLAAHPTSCERIPMLPDATSLANRDAWAAHEAALGDAAASAGAGASPLMRQDICGNFVNVDDWRISALNLSNAVAVVLYEALRQTGFAGMGDGA
ncbi:tRNA (cytidine(34)-2'-O)-methyltransferase [Parafannyhessea umbonata]|uniref:tRNA (cytidine(34)-2'-O)-methyltransferase n=1 Tax=Parafannyhessea umbonata TaxID=604330 RepID=UPI00359C3A36